MYPVLIWIIAGIFIALLFANIYFRFRVLKHYRILRKNKVEFPAYYIMKEERMEKEVLHHYPGFEENIRAFCKHIRISVKIASAILFFITLLGAIIMYFDKYAG